MEKKRRTYSVNTSTTQIMTFRVPHEIAARAREHSSYTGQTMTGIVLAALKEYLDRHTPMDCIEEGGRD